MFLLLNKNIYFKTEHEYEQNQKQWAVMATPHRSLKEKFFAYKLFEDYCEGNKV